MMALVLYTGRKSGKLSYRIVSACCPTIAAADAIWRPGRGPLL
jgi:hypothetical protein